jgi:lysophospholipase L1-like esterase
MVATCVIGHQAARGDDKPSSAAHLPTLFIIGDSTVKNGSGTGADGLWDQVPADMKPRDFVLMQFGHNDGGPLNSARRTGETMTRGENAGHVVLRCLPHHFLKQHLLWEVKPRSPAILETFKNS